MCVCVCVCLCVSIYLVIYLSHVGENIKHDISVLDISICERGPHLVERTESTGRIQVLMDGWREG